MIFGKKYEAAKYKFEKTKQMDDKDR